MTDILPIKTQWLPADWLDEAGPNAQDDPSAFIRRSLGDQYLIMPVENSDGDEPCYEWRVSPGEIVNFACMRVWPAIEVTARAGGEIIRSDPIPNGATLFWHEHDTDTVGESLSALIYDLCQDIAVGDEATFDVEPYDWSLSADFRLVVDEACPRFERVILSSES